MPLEIYQQLLEKYQQETKQFRKKLQLLSTIRLAIFIASLFFFYCYLKTDTLLLLAVAILCLGTFLYFIRLYDIQKRKLDITEALATINKNEINILNGMPAPYENGKAYINTHHSYTYDLDIFGENSLYQFINRTTTSFGKEALASSLLNPSKDEIIDRQLAIKELADQINFRQLLQANGIIHQGEEKKLSSLQHWLKKKPVFSRPAYYYLLCLFPLATILSISLYLITEQEIYKSVIGLLFVVNLSLSFLFSKKMMGHITVSSDISKTLHQFSEQLLLIEKANWQSENLKKIQAQLSSSNIPASTAIKDVCSRFKYMDMLLNIFLSPIFNGLFLFHIHILFQLDEWKKKFGEHITDWLIAIGEAEALSSYATLGFNNPDFCFPTTSKEESVSTVSMGHPLIRQVKRVTNSISFNEKKFIILTGSNMSGKSTFLRTLGVNLVLANAGSPVCASEFNFYPFEVYVSMRITDSLQENESFFYAELKRLHTIIQQINSGIKTFILLDEILRGTNSNDKSNGTIGLIKKMVAGKALGIIATHDLTVGNLTNEYPDYLSNKCFESAIINDELNFDYKIKEGVCNKLSASFLMKKMGIIDNS